MAIKSILIYGPARAGKAELVFGLAERGNHKAFIVDAPFSYGDGKEITHNTAVCIVEGAAYAHFLFRTFVGGFFSRDVWDPYILGADGIILALDSDPDKQASNLVMIHHLEKVAGNSTKLGCIVCTKADTGFDLLPVMSTIKRAQDILQCAHLPVFWAYTMRPEMNDVPMVFMMKSMGG